ncbi:hypothetical protein, partial [Bacillus pumilus]|uniref:hypothetical protein n=1 Tax=Bacillus pumilus TaxID=1408 RepID=UPI003F68B42B
MAPIAALNIPPHKPLLISLTYLFPIRPTTPQQLLKQPPLSQHTPVPHLTQHQLPKIPHIIHKLKLEG